MRTPGRGEQLIDSYTRQGFGDALRRWSPGMSEDAVDEYWKAFADGPRRISQLDLYRSQDFQKLAPYEGCLSRLTVPALILWGGQDPTARVDVARRFERELWGSELAILERAGHFLWEDEPATATQVLVEFLDRLPALTKEAATGGDRAVKASVAHDKGGVAAQSGRLRRGEA